MPAKLKVLRSGSVVEEFDITKPAILIGKGAHCDLILNFPGVGREMARLTAEKDGFYLNDVSLLGVFVSGRRITRQRIEPGQEILCGSVKMSLIDEPPVQAPVSGGYTSARELWETARSKETQRNLGALLPAGYPSSHVTSGWSRRTERT